MGEIKVGQIAVTRFHPDLLTYGLTSRGGSVRERTGTPFRYLFSDGNGVPVRNRKT